MAVPTATSPSPQQQWAGNSVMSMGISHGNMTPIHRYPPSVSLDNEDGLEEQQAGWPPEVRSACHHQRRHFAYFEEGPGR